VFLPRKMRGRCKIPIDKVCVNRAKGVDVNMILGIDPGFSGAIAIYDPQTNDVIHVMTIPTLMIERNKKIKRTLDFHRLFRSIAEYAQNTQGLRAVIEQVGAMPGQGVSSMFAFGAVAGAIEMAVVAAGIPYTKVPPVTWKKALGCTADKDGALLRANQLMPLAVQHWTPIRGERDKQDCIGIAEASLLAYYGAKNLT